MTVINWGMLAKSQIDPEKIEEAIARLILEHNENEEAHLGAGQSLQSHKASEIIDHLVNSIITDKIKDREVTTEKLFDFGRQRVSLSLETLDVWEYSEAGITMDFGELYITTGGVINTERSAYVRPGLKPDWAKNFTSQWVLKLTSITNQLFYIVSGSLPPFEDEDQGVGFKVVNGTLYALHVRSDGSTPVEYTTQISGITLTNDNIYKIIFYPGEKIEFYVNDVLKATHTTNLPSVDWAQGNACSIYLKNTAAAWKYALIHQVYFAKNL